MGRLGPVTFNAALDARAQQTAMLMKANARLSHNPPSSWRCYNAEAAAGARTSNLGLGSGQYGGAVTMRGYMDDIGLDSVGHRRWLMHAPLTQMGHGATNQSDALLVIGAPESDTQPDPRWVSWPTAGYVPVQVEPGGWWSLSANTEFGATNFRNARVSVTRNGSPAGVTKRPQLDGSGPDTLVF